MILAIMASHSKQLEDGELSQGDSPVKTPLSSLHKKKLSALDGGKVKDSLKRSRKRCATVQDDSESGSDDASATFEGSIMSGLKRQKTAEISLRQTGLLESKLFIICCEI